MPPRRAGLTVHAVSASGSYQVGPDRGRLLLHTSRVGLAASAGHDLTIEVGRWSGEVRVADEVSASSVDITVQLPTLRVVAGTGGVKPLSERDKREIAQNARRQLDADRTPEARFVSTAVRAGAGGGTIEGTFSLRGKENPLTLTVTDLGGGRYRATGEVAQSAYGIVPFTAFFGALKLADRVEIEAEVELSGP